MATVFSPRGKALSVSTADALWLARAVEGEGEPRRAVAQTLVNRWAWLADSSPGAYPTLKSLVEAYAQAVNPRWLGDGDLHIAYINAHPSEFAREFAASQRRQANRERNDFTAATRAAVHQALDGPITIEPGTVHFGKPVDGQNQLFRGEGSGAWALYTLGTEGPSHRLAAVLEHGKPSAAIAVVLLGVGAGFVLSRSYRRRR